MAISVIAKRQSSKQGVVKLEGDFIMSKHFQNHRGLQTIFLLAVLAVLCSVATSSIAQDQQDQPTPKWEIFGGYSFFYPGADVHGLLPGGLLPVSNRLESNPRGAGASLTYNFNRWLGVTGDISGHWDSNETTVVQRINDAAFYNLSVGPKLTFRSRHFSPFLEGLVGEHRLSPDLFQRDDRFGFMAGGGLDVNLSRHFALRLIRGDYVFSNHHFGPDATVPETDVRGVRLQSGIVFMFGGKSASPAVSANCVLNPDEVMAGEPVTATVTANNFNSNHTLRYSWSSTGGKVSGNDATASIDTNGAAAGNYTVTASVSDTRRRKGGQASCSANFRVTQPAPQNPPTMSCMASPSTVQAGSASTINCTCTSPNNSPVTVSGWSASGGSVSGSGSAAALDTSGASPGTITVTASCADSRGLNAQAEAQVTVEAPPVVSPEIVQLETRLALHSVYFATAKPTMHKPDGGLLGSQQETLVSLASDFQKYLQAKPDAHLILEGHADPRGSVEYNQALSERRVDRTKRFLIEHGVPRANIETKGVGEEQNLTEGQVRDAVEKNPELTADQRQRVLDNLQTILLASNRRVDVTLSTTGQQSVRQYPFNAADSLSLLSQERTKRPTGTRPGQMGKSKVQP